LQGFDLFCVGLVLFRRGLIHQAHLLIFLDILKDLIGENKSGSLFTGVACGGGTSCAGCRWRAETIPSSSYSEGRENFLYIFTSARSTGDVFFLSYWN